MFTDLIYTLTPLEVNKSESTIQTWEVKNLNSVSLDDEAFSLQRAVDDFQMILALCFETLSPCSLAFKASIKLLMSL